MFNRLGLRSSATRLAAILALALLAIGLAAITSPPAVTAAGVAAVDGSLPGNGVVPPSVVDAPSCASFLTSGGADPGGANTVCQSIADLTQLFGGSLTFNKIFSCSYAQSANIVAGRDIDRAALASCLGLPDS